MLLAHDDASPSSPTSVIRNNSLIKTHLDSRNIPRRSIEAEIQRTSTSPNNGSKNLRRVRSDDLAQFKRDEPSVRRSIFGHYFKEKPRSYSAPHLAGVQPPPPVPNTQQQSPKRSYRRSSSLNNDQSHRNEPVDYRVFAHHNQPVDYRVFAPSEQQVNESAICCRYRELNREHQKDYDSLVERQVQVEHSLPPFPSPLVRFCSDTTANVAGSDSRSSFKISGSRRGGTSYFSSSDGEMHYHGVYSLLTPISILRPSSYTNKTGTIGNKFLNESSVSIMTQTEELKHPISTPLSCSFNLTRSCIGKPGDLNPGVLKNFLDTPTDVASVTIIGIQKGDEEKKENDNAFVAPSSTQGIILFSNKVISDSSSSITDTTGITSDDDDGKFCGYNDSQDKMDFPQDLHQDRHLRFDPRVTVTEFEDPVPRNWYHDSELDGHKREAISLAQSYLREHPAVAGWYRRAILDPITKTYRKRALFSLPVFSSTYSSCDADPITEINNSGDGQTKTSHNQSSVSSSSSSQQGKQLTPSIKKILIVHPSPAIASLFAKSLKSMFPSAEMFSTGSTEEASRLINQSFAPNSTVSFDIIIIEQRLNPQGISSKSSNNEKKLNHVFKGPVGLLSMLMNKSEEESRVAAATISPTNRDIRCGSDLIHQACELSSQNQRPSSSACLLIGVSVRPERDTMVMRQAGADIVWGIPIPSVGATLRNKLFTKLLAKRSSASPRYPDR
jgi:hypothetical protein